MKLMYITNDPEIAQYAEKCGVQRIFVDMEYIGKDHRQGQLDTHKAQHSPSDVTKIKEKIATAEIMVRVNPLYDGSIGEVEEVVAVGADVIMLPMFTTADEVEAFIRIVNKRAKICLLLETPQALVRLDKILEMSDEIDEIHIGLNDLHLGMGLDFMFELISGGLVDFAAAKIKAKGIKFGIGGIACIGEGLLPAELILSEHVRLGSEMVILARSFHHNASSLKDLFAKVDLEKEIAVLQKTYNDFKLLDEPTLLENLSRLKEHVSKIIAPKANAKMEQIINIIQ